MITSKKCLKIPQKCTAVRTHFAIRAEKKKGITDVEAVFAKKTDEINAELPLYKRIVKTIVRSSEFDKTASGKIKRKHNS